MTRSPDPLTPASSCRSIAVWLFVSLLAMNVLLTRGHFFSTDEVAVYQQTRSLWERGDLDVSSMPNTWVGPGGRTYALYGIGQSVLALPLYVLGKGIRQGLERAGATGWIRAFAGPVIGSGSVLWGGEVEIFFVNLFNCFAIAALVVVYFLFSVELGARPRWALVASGLLAFTTHVAGFSTGFFQHGAEAQLLLWTFYLLFRDRAAPSGRRQLLAGIVAGMMVMVRVSTVPLLPVLTIYLLWNTYAQMPAAIGAGSRLRRMTGACGLFLAPIAIALVGTAAVNAIKFGGFTIQGAYGRVNPMTGNVLVSLYGYLCSPGQSVVLFSPLLLLAPWYFRPFVRRHIAESAAIFALAAVYIGFFSVSEFWHGQWAFGPRYLLALVAPLLLPLAAWLPTLRWPGAVVVAVLAAVGVFIEVLHVAINVSYVYFAEGYYSGPGVRPNLDFLFVPGVSQIPAHWKALLAWDHRVDMWVVNLVRQDQTPALIWIGLVLSLVLAWSVTRLVRLARLTRSPDRAHL